MLLLRAFFFPACVEEGWLLCIELTSAVTLSLSVNALVEGRTAIDWRDFGLLGLVGGGFIIHRPVIPAGLIPAFKPENVACWKIRPVHRIEFEVMLEDLV